MWLPASPTATPVHTTSPSLEHRVPWGGGRLLRDGSMSCPVPWMYELRGPWLGAGSRAPLSPFPRGTQRDPPLGGAVSATVPSCWWHGLHSFAPEQQLCGVWEARKYPRPEDASASEVCVAVGQSPQGVADGTGVQEGCPGPKLGPACGQPQRLPLGSALPQHIPRHPGAVPRPRGGLLPGPT